MRHSATKIEQNAASFLPINIPTYVSGSVSAAAAAVVNRFEDLGNVVVTNTTHICIDNLRTAAMLVVDEC
jgi:hypothetical protein